MTITADIIKAIAPVCKAPDAVAQALQAAVEELGVKDVAMFVAQCAHESDHFRTTVEYASGAAYEGRKDLGNTESGDGRKFKGRGYIQLTGRANYAKAGAYFGVDFLEHPEWVAQPEWAAKVSAWFFAVFAKVDGLDITRATKRINGGLNGIKQRTEFYEKARKLLSPVIAPIIETPVKEENMDPFTITAISALLREVPDLIRIFGKNGENTERNAQAAAKVVNIVQAITGEYTAQAAIQAIKVDPDLKQAVQQSIRESWMELTEIGGGIDEARKFAASVQNSPYAHVVEVVSYAGLGLIGFANLVVFLALGIAIITDHKSIDQMFQMASTLVQADIGASLIVFGFWLGSSVQKSRTSAEVRE